LLGAFLFVDNQAHSQEIAPSLIYLVLSHVVLSSQNGWEVIQASFLEPPVICSCLSPPLLDSSAELLDLLMLIHSLGYQPDQSCEPGINGGVQGLGGIDRICLPASFLDDSH